MLSYSLATAFFLGLVAAQSPSPTTMTTMTTMTMPSSTSASSSPMPSATGVAGLVAQLPTCALSCFAQSATQVGCTGASDFSCLCNVSKAADLLTKTGLCVGIGNGCDIAKTGVIAGQICNALSGGPSQADLSSASAIVSSELATATKKNAAAKPTARAIGAIGAMGAAAAFAVIAL